MTKINDLLFAKLRKRTVELEKTVDFERVHFLNEAYKRFDGETPILLRAKFYDLLLRNKSIYIDENLFAGSLGDGPGKFYLYPEFCVDWTKDPKENFTVPEEYQKDWQEVCDYWETRTLETRGFDQFHRRYDWVGEKYGFDIAQGFADGLQHDANHQPWGGGNLNYEKVVKRGLNDLIQEAKDHIRQLDTTLEDSKKYAFYEAAIIEMQAIVTLAKRYAELAGSLAKTEEDPDQKENLEQIAEVMEQVPAKPARTLREAIQTVLFMHIAAELEQVGCAYSLGYLGQVLDPYYQKDKEEGRISEEEAVYYLKHFYLKLNDIAYYYGDDYERLNSGDLAQTINVGGYDVNGNDATVEFDFLILEAQRQVRLPQPPTALICHNRLNPALIDKAYEVVATGIGMPQFMNGDVMVQRSLEAYSRYGATIADARRSGVYGCVSTAICNKSVFLGGAQFNLAKNIELALNDGRDPATGHQLGPHTGKAEDFKNFGEFLAAFEKQVEVAVFLARKLGQIGNIVVEEVLPLPLRSALVDGCLESGLDIYSGGTKFFDTQFTYVGGVDTANSLSAIKKLVYDEEKLTIAELKEALKADFNGFEEIQNLLLDAPKHGNGDKAAGEMVQYVYRYAFDVFEKTGPNYLGLYARPDAYSKSVHNYFGLVTGALPSGRKAGVALTDGSVSATPGTDLKGPTALIADAAKAIDSLSYDSAHFNVKLSPDQLKTLKGRAAVQTLVKSYMDLGGNHIQFNCIDAEILKDAKAHPENHKDLVVRVAGFSAYFIKLHEGVQNEIIARTQHAV